MTRDVSLAIGVASAKPLAFLSGAINGARAFDEWASKVGYESTLLIDEREAVTIPRLRGKLDEILDPAKAPIHRMLLYFAGHGLIREAEEGLWLLSDWYREQRAVAVEVLRRRLYMHNIQQIAIFSDCCRSLPPDVSAADLAADPVLGRGPIRPEKPPRIDKFIAAQDGAATFMVPGARPEEDRCLFSGVLMEGLWGKNAAAYSRLLKDKVTSRSLGEYLGEEVPRRAQVYQRRLTPTVLPTFPEGDDIYFYSGSGEPPEPPAFPDWPSPQDVAAMGLHGVDDESTGLEGGVAPSEDTPAAVSLLERMRDQPRPERFETGAGFAVDGAHVEAVWTTSDVIAESHGQPGWWRFRDETAPFLQRSAPALIEFEDGTFAAVAVLPRFIATVLRDQRGVSALVYRPVYQRSDTASMAEEAISIMEGGALRANAATDLAVKLRGLKHEDPVLGVISAYLYDSIGDIDSIRRMAFYYVRHLQPIPFDIALLAQLRGERRADGVLQVHVPPVSGRDPMTETERRHHWTHEATPPADGEVGGLWPWMRQGWPFLYDPTADDSALVAPGLLKISGHLAPGRFTTLGPEGGRELARIFDLQQREQ